MWSVYLISIFSVLLFTTCVHMLMKNVLKPIPVVNTSDYNRLALKVKRSYSILAWSIMSASFLVAVTVSFYQVYIEL